jgi:hypothetical protein
MTPGDASESPAGVCCRLKTRMKQEQFESRVLEIWMRSRIPLTAAHVQHLTGAPRGKVGRWLDEMTAGGVLDVDVGDDGEMIWRVRGADRPKSGPATVAEFEKMERLAAEVRGATSALAQLSSVTGLARRSGGEQKSVVASGALSLFLGPVGWLYAAPLREAVPAVAVVVAAGMFLPAFLLTPLLGVVAPLSGIAGAYYAWRHNQTGERTGLFSDRKKPRG